MNYLDQLTALTAAARSFSDFLLLVDASMSEVTSRSCLGHELSQRRALTFSELFASERRLYNALVEWSNYWSSLPTSSDSNWKTADTLPSALKRAKHRKQILAMGEIPADSLNRWSTAYLDLLNLVNLSAIEHVLVTPEDRRELARNVVQRLLMRRPRAILFLPRSLMDVLGMLPTEDTMLGPGVDYSLHVHVVGLYACVDRLHSKCAQEFASFGADCRAEHVDKCRTMISSMLTFFRTDEVSISLPDPYYDFDQGCSFETLYQIARLGPVDWRLFQGYWFWDLLHPAFEHSRVISVLLPPAPDLFVETTDPASHAAFRRAPGAFIDDRRLWRDSVRCCALERGAARMAELDTELQIGGYVNGGTEFLARIAKKEARIAVNSSLAAGASAGACYFFLTELGMSEGDARTAAIVTLASQWVAAWVGTHLGAESD